MLFLYLYGFLYYIILFYYSLVDFIDFLRLFLLL